MVSEYFKKTMKEQEGKDRTPSKKSLSEYHHEHSFIAKQKGGKNYEGYKPSTAKSHALHEKMEGKKGEKREGARYHKKHPAGARELFKDVYEKNLSPKYAGEKRGLSEKAANKVFGKEYARKHSIGLV